MALSRKHFKELANILNEHGADPVMVRDIADEINRIMREPKDD